MYSILCNKLISKFDCLKDVQLCAKGAMFNLINVLNSRIFNKKKIYNICVQALLKMKDFQERWEKRGKK